MTTLMYSRKNDTLMTYGQLANLPTPKPLGRFHHPYPFKDYVTDIYEALDHSRLEVREEQYAVTNDNQRLFGLMEIGPQAGSGELISSEDWAITLGLRGSHDQRIPRGLVLGTHVMVCSNLCFHGDVASFTTKQTLNIASRLPTLIKDAVRRIPDMALDQEQVFNQMKAYGVDPADGDNVLVDLYRIGAFSSPQLTRAIDQWHSPDYPEHAEDGWNAWRLFNACTEALKPTGTSTNMHLVEQRSRKVSEYIEQRVRLVGHAA